MSFSEILRRFLAFCYGSRNNLTKANIKALVYTLRIPFAVHIYASLPTHHAHIFGINFNSFRHLFGFLKFPTKKDP